MTTLFDNLLGTDDEIHVQRIEDCEAGVYEGVQALIRTADGRSEHLPHIVRHSPTGFEYGYGGSGPADLALSILTACVGSDLAEQFYQGFKWEHVANRKEGAWTIGVGQVRDWIANRSKA